MMAKKIIFFLTAILFLFFLLSDSGLAACDSGPDCPQGQGCVEGECVRALEVIYPRIPGLPIPETVATELPEYVNYIFRLSVIIIGFIIFGVLVYSGIRYLISVGDPAKLSDAREGILASLLGAVILLSAYLIFNTINPQLTILELPKVDPLAQVVMPGVYICSYAVPDIADVLNRYIDQGPVPEDFDARKAKTEQQIEAAKQLREIMFKSEAERCPRANFSGNFEGFTVSEGCTMFMVPTIKLVSSGAPPTWTRVPIYEYAVVLHEKDDFEGGCQVYAKEGPIDIIYTVVTKNPDGTISYDFVDHQFTDLMVTGLPFNKAKSVTIFRKPLKEPSGEGIILYKCLDYDRTGMCPEGVDVDETTGVVTGSPQTFNTGGADILRIATSGGLQGMADNTRSIRIDPKGSYFALFFEEESFRGKCGVIKDNDPNLLDRSIGRCGNCTKLGKFAAWWIHIWSVTLLDPSTDCHPCLKSMIVIKGQVL